MSKYQITKRTYADLSHKFVVQSKQGQFVSSRDIATFNGLEAARDYILKLEGSKIISEEVIE